MRALKFFEGSEFMNNKSSLAKLQFLSQKMSMPCSFQIVFQIVHKFLKLQTEPYTPGFN